MLIRDNLDFKIHSTEVDSQVATFSWRLIFRIRLTFFLNIYAPNKCIEQFLFFKDVSDILKGARVERDTHILWVGTSLSFLATF